MRPCRSGPGGADLVTSHVIREVLGCYLGRKQGAKASVGVTVDLYVHILLSFDGRASTTGERGGPTVDGTV